MSAADIATTIARVEQAGQYPALSDLERLLSLEDPRDQQMLFEAADRVRKRHVGDGILLRGLIEFSNHCVNTCYYCGLNRNNTSLERYRLSDEEILGGVALMSSQRIATVVLQAGEDDGIDPETFAKVVREIKGRFGISITLSVGEWPRSEFALWKDAGADRYLLKIESSDKALYESLHAHRSFENRLRCVADLQSLGYQVGSGCMVGIKGQTPAHLARDILYFAHDDFDMIGIGPFIPHPRTPLADEQRGGVEMTLKAVALTRIVTRNSHLPATTALGSLEQDFRIQGLKAGANVLMPNFTPVRAKKLYEIYPGKRCIEEPAGACAFCMEGLAASIGRHIDYSAGDSLKGRRVSAGARAERPAPALPTL
jgi:biotin synthase